PDRHLSDPAWRGLRPVLRFQAITRPERRGFCELAMRCPGRVRPCADTGYLQDRPGHDRPWWPTWWQAASDGARHPEPKTGTDHQTVCRRCVSDGQDCRGRPRYRPERPERTE